MRDDIEFRFVTRTKFADYRVFYNGGSETLSNRDDFRPLRQKCDIIEGEQCACVFTENDRFYLVVSALDADRTDERGRAIRFSFCQIFDDASEAASAFVKVKNHWEEVESWIHEHLEETDEGTGVDFDEAAFMRFLQEDGEGKLKLKRGKVTKWTRSDNEIRYPDIQIVHDVTVNYTAESPRSKIWMHKTLAGIAAVAGLALVIIAGCYVIGPKAEVEELQKRITESPNVPSESESVRVESDDNVPENLETLEGKL